MSTQRAQSNVGMRRSAILIGNSFQARMTGVPALMTPNPLATNTLLIVPRHRVDVAIFPERYCDHEDVCHTKAALCV